MNLRENGKDELLALVQESTGVRIHFVRQAYTVGIGTCCPAGEILRRR